MRRLNRLVAVVFLAALAGALTPVAEVGAAPGPIAARAQAGNPVEMAVPAAGTTTTSTAPPASQPNVVVLLIDDFPAMDDRVFSRLTNIKSMFLDQGAHFTNYWANFSLCCPGRAALLTGQRDDHNGMMKNDARLFDPSETIATELQSQGYYTGIVGKYFNRTGLLPSKVPRGWDYISISNRGQYYDYPLWVNGVLEKHGHLPTDYSTDVLADKSAHFLESAPRD